VVNLGYSDRQWKPMDGYIKKLRDEGIAVHAALGNHEVMGKAKTGERKFQQRFPNHVKTGFVEILDSVAVVMLNSNFGKLSKKEDDEQIAWYKKTLAELDADSSILFIISGCHHSPYTNSKIVGASKDVQDRFVKPFIQSAKSRLFLSGHCHGFEHYKMEGKDFMVIGGGGGLHQPLKTAGSFDDLAKDYKPMFHYITVERKGKELDVKSFKLCNKFEVFEEGFVLNISQDLSADRNLASKSPKEETSTTQ
nr:metallophosphoesterase [Flavisolibacter sp.]